MPEAPKSTSLQLFDQIRSSNARIGVVVALSLTSTVAGPLGFPDIGLAEHPPVLDQCPSCAFITGIDDIPLQPDPWQPIIVYGLMSLLLVAGFIGLSRRVRVRR